MILDTENVANCYSYKDKKFHYDGESTSHVFLQLSNTEIINNLKHEYQDIKISSYCVLYNNNNNETILYIYSQAKVNERIIYFRSGSFDPANTNNSKQQLIDKLTYKNNKIYDLQNNRGESLKIYQVEDDIEKIYTQTDITILHTKQDLHILCHKPQNEIAIIHNQEPLKTFKIKNVKDNEDLMVFMHGDCLFGNKYISFSIGEMSQTIEILTQENKYRRFNITNSFQGLSPTKVSKPTEEQMFIKIPVSQDHFQKIQEVDLKPRNKKPKAITDHVQVSKPTQEQINSPNQDDQESIKSPVTQKQINLPSKETKSVTQYSLLYYGLVFVLCIVLIRLVVLILNRNSNVNDINRDISVILNSNS